MNNIISLEGPLELINQKLVLIILLEAGGVELSCVASGIAHIEGDFLILTIPNLLADKLGIVEGGLLVVDNQNSKFNIRVSS